MLCEKKNRPLMFNVDRKGPPFQWETRQAGTVDPRVGIFLSSLNINDGFYLSGMQEKTCCKGMVFLLPHGSCILAPFDCVITLILRANIIIAPL